MKKLIFPDPNNRYLNLGGGKWYYPKWENVDLYQDDIFVDYKIDFRDKQPLPFLNNKTNGIFTSHLLEHLDDDSVIFLLKECYRILKFNGILRISVPDMDKAIEAYKNKDHIFFDKGGVSCRGDNLARKFVNYFASFRLGEYSGGPIVSPNVVRKKFEAFDKYSFAKWCVSLIPKSAPYKAHVNAFDYQKLKKILNDIGFSKVYKSKFRGSKRVNMRVFEFDNRPMVSLFLEAIK